MEGLVGCVRRNFVVSVPSFKSCEALNAYIERRSLERMDARLRGLAETIGQRMERDLEALLPLQVAPYDASDKQAGQVVPHHLSGTVPTPTRHRWPTVVHRV